MFISRSEQPGPADLVKDASQPPGRPLEAKEEGGASEAGQVDGKGRDEVVKVQRVLLLATAHRL